MILVISNKLGRTSNKNIWKNLFNSAFKYLYIYNLIKLPTATFNMNIKCIYFYYIIGMFFITFITFIYYFLFYFKKFNEK